MKTEPTRLAPLTANPYTGSSEVYSHEIIEPSGRKVALILDQGSDARSEQLATLLAAAQDLLAALWAASDALTELDPLGERHNAKLIDAAIAKATGGAS